MVNERRRGIPYRYEYDLRLIKGLDEMVKTNVVDPIASAEDDNFGLYLFKKK